MKSKLCFIGGAPRTGKTTLSRRLIKEYGFSHLAVDSIVHAFEHSSPPSGIAHLTGNDLAVMDKISEFLYEQIRWHINHDIPLVVEGYHLKPEHFRKYMGDIPFQSVFFGYARPAEADKMLRSIRASETPSDWTRSFSDDQMLGYLSGFIETDRFIEQNCKEHNCRYMPVTGNLDETAREAYRILTL